MRPPPPCRRRPPPPPVLSAPAIVFFFFSSFLCATAALLFLMAVQGKAMAFRNTRAHSLLAAKVAPTLSSARDFCPDRPPTDTRVLSLPSAAKSSAHYSKLLPKCMSRAGLVQRGLLRSPETPLISPTGAQSQPDSLRCGQHIKNWPVRPRVWGPSLLRRSISVFRCRLGVPTTPWQQAVCGVVVPLPAPAATA